MNDAAKKLTDDLIAQLGDTAENLATALTTMGDSAKVQLRRALGMVVAGFIKDDWKTLVITLNEDEGALILAASTGVTDIDAAEIVDLAKDAILTAATADAPSRSDWN